MRTNISITPDQQKFINAERSVLDCRSLYVKSRTSSHHSIDTTENWLNSHVSPDHLRELSKKGYITKPEGGSHWYVKLDNLVAPVPITRHMMPATNRPFADMKYPAYSG